MVMRSDGSARRDRRALSSRGLLRPRARSIWTGMGGGGKDIVLWRLSIPWAGDSLAGGILAGA